MSPRDLVQHFYVQKQTTLNCLQNIQKRNRRQTTEKKEHNAKNRETNAKTKQEHKTNKLQVPCDRPGPQTTDHRPQRPALGKRGGQRAGGGGRPRHVGVSGDRFQIQTYAQKLSYSTHFVHTTKHNTKKHTHTHAKKNGDFRKSSVESASMIVWALGLSSA